MAQGVSPELTPPVPKEKKKKKERREIHIVKFWKL
jgi:hypothetical protein